ncbi:hypothetical protein MAR_017697 [Mya arenaria]|uniref:Uncharacterized protein n=1 Tax=Mya arenaria TaxID=6604 RepID=A0ABY7EF13_MYAAR|nr:hypothetical protein MAR_017697 [Mya arenaria]
MSRPISHWQLVEKYARFKEKVDGMERYLADLPTLEEFTKNAEDIFFIHNKQKHLAGKMREVSAEIYRMKTHGEGKALALCQEELAETREVNDKVTRDLGKAKKEKGEVTF